MRGVLINHTGAIFGRLKVLRRAANNQWNQPCWVCQCMCGNQVTVTGCSLNLRTSCGCAKIKHGHASRRGKSVEYMCFKNMHSRCKNTNNPEFVRYGARGIKICRRWSGENGFVNFLADMGKRPSKNLSIERRENSKGYTPDNCYWGTTREQGRNKRSVKLTLEQVKTIRALATTKQPLKDIAKQFEIDASHVSRICSNKSWSE